MENNTYSARARCTNCGHEARVDIPKGIPMKVYEEKIRCEYCECGCVIVPLQD